MTEGGGVTTVAPGADPAARHRQVLGDRPRIAPLRVDQLTGDLTELLRQMIGVNAALRSREAETLTDIFSDEPSDPAADTAQLLARLPEIIRTMLRHPALLTRQTEVGVQLLVRGLLPARDRELAILRVAWLCQAPYEWGEHVMIARKAGVTGPEIAAIVAGSADPSWGTDDRAILRAVEELHADAMIADATWAVLARRFDERQLIELPILIGQYQTVAYYQNALRLRLHEGNAGLAAR